MSDWRKEISITLVRGQGQSVEAAQPRRQAACIHPSLVQGGVRISSRTSIEAATAQSLQRCLCTDACAKLG